MSMPKQRRSGRAFAYREKNQGGSMPTDFVDQCSGQVKRPPNAFFLFSSYLRPILKKKLLPQSEKQPVNVLKTIGALWKCMTKAQRKPFLHKAEQLNVKHRKIFPSFVHIHNHVVHSKSAKVLPEEPRRDTSPISIQPFPGQVSSTKIPSPIQLPWCDRGRRPNPTPTRKEKPVQKKLSKVAKKIVITDPSKVKFRVVPKYRHSRYIPTFKKKKEREARRNNVNQKKVEVSSRSSQTPKTKTFEGVELESVCSLDEIPDHGILNCDLNIDALLDDISFPDNFYGEQSEQDVQFSIWLDGLSPPWNLSDLCHQCIDEQKGNFERLQLCQNQLVDQDNCNETFSESQEFLHTYNKLHSKNNWWQEFEFLCSPNDNSVASPGITRGEDCPQEDLAAMYNDEAQAIGISEPGVIHEFFGQFEIQCPQTKVDEHVDVNKEQQYGLNDSVHDGNKLCEDHHNNCSTNTSVENDVLSQESIPDFTYSATPSWESMVNPTPSVVTNCSTEIFASSSETSVNDSINNTHLEVSSVAKCKNLLSGESSEALFRSSTPLTPSSNNDGMSPATSQLINDCLDDENAPDLSPFLSRVACMTSPIESNFSSKFVDVSGESTSLDRFGSQREHLYTSPVTTGAKSSTSLSSGCQMIACFAPPRKRARRSISQPNLSPQSTHTPRQNFPMMLGYKSQSPEGFNPSRFSKRDALQTSTKARRVPSLTADDAQMMMSGFETPENMLLTEFEYLQSRQTCLDIHDPIEKANAVEALLKEHF